MYLSKVLVKCEQPRDLKKSLLFISTVSLKVNKALYLLVLAGTLRVFAEYSPNFMSSTSNLINHYITILMQICHSFFYS